MNQRLERENFELGCKEYDPDTTLDHIYRQQNNIIEYILSQNDGQLLLRSMKVLTGTQLNALKLYDTLNLSIK